MLVITCSKADVHYHVEMLDEEINEANIYFTLGGYHDDANNLNIIDLPAPLSEISFDAENMYALCDDGTTFHDITLSEATKALDAAGFVRGDDW